MADTILVSTIENREPPEWSARVEPFVRKVMEKLGYDGEELSILFCDDAFISEMNSAYRHVEGPTDILSFENGDTYTDDQGATWKCAGDILISVETLMKNADYFGVSPDAELKRLLVHGVLHLNGMDHGEEHIEQGKTPECEMLRIQEQTLAALTDEHIIE